MRFLLYTTLFTFLLLLQTCKMGDIQDQPQNPDAPTIESGDVAQFRVKAGTYDRSFRMSDGKAWNLKIFVPELAETDTVPLVLALHWAGNRETYKEYADCLAFPALKELNAIVVAPSSEGLHWVRSIMETRVQELIEEIIEHWSVHENQVIVTGYSNGGIGSWEYIKKYPHLFRAAIPMAGIYDDSKVETPTYVIHGEKDELFNAQTVEATLKRSIAKGSPIELQLVEDFSHYMACAYVEVLKENALRMKKEVLED